MQNPWLELKKKVAESVDADVNSIEEPERFGDFAFACFGLAKERKKNPAEVAREIAASLKIEGISKVEATGPYVNFYIDWEKFSGIVLKSIDDKYGSFGEKETVIMDVFQPNPFKPFHIGHIRNAVLGESIRRILDFYGNKTIAVSYMGDVGTHVAKWLWYYKNFYKGQIPNVDVSKWAGEIYAESTRKIEEKPEYEEQVKEMNSKLDRRDPEILGLWKQIRDLCLEDFWSIRDELGVHIDGNFYESEVEGPGKDIVKKLLDEGKAQISEGAVVVNLEKYDLETFLLLKSDGTALYSTKDLGLQLLKAQRYRFDKSLFIVASEQEFYFKQLLKTMEVFKIPGWEKSAHVSYGLVVLKEGKMSSRYGTVILYEDLRDEMMEKVKEKLKDTDKDIQDIIKKVAFGAIKFPMLSIESKKTITFDWEQALDFEGKSGPYLQYSYVRALNILNKAEQGEFDASNLKEESEIKLIKKMAVFPDVVRQAAEQYSPNLVANYVFELAQDFNSFYHDFPVLKAEDDIRNARLRLVEAVKTILETSLNLLGIPLLEKM